MVTIDPCAFSVSRLSTITNFWLLKVIGTTLSFFMFSPRCISATLGPICPLLSLPVGPLYLSTIYISLLLSPTQPPVGQRDQIDGTEVVNHLVWLNLWFGCDGSDPGRLAGNSPSSRQTELNNRLRLRQGLGGAGNTTVMYRRRPLNIIWSKILHWATGLMPALMKAVRLVIWIMRCSRYWKVQGFSPLKASEVWGCLISRQVLN